MVQLIQTFSRWAVPLMIVLIPLIGYLRGVKVYEAFVEGAKEGFTTVVKIIPFLVAMFVGINVLRQTGAMDLIAQFVSPVTDRLGIPSDVLPLALIRPLSGSGSLGALSELYRSAGPDSLAGMIGSVMQGSTETTFYVLTVYCGAVGVRRVRHALPISLVTDVIAFLAAVVITRGFIG